jgi:uncharacterized membrane protein (UPF0127 family)
MQAGEGLLIPKCVSVHTIGMKFPIDVLFVDWAAKVRHIYRSMQPGCRTTPVLENQDNNWVVELPSGGALSTEVGDQITFTRL